MFFRDYRVVLCVIIWVNGYIVVCLVYGGSIRRSREIGGDVKEHVKIYGELHGAS